MRNIELKIKQLIDEINFHNAQYHGLDDPKISDQDFDQLVRELVNLEHNHPELIQAESPRLSLKIQVIWLLMKILDQKLKKHQISVLTSSVKINW